MGRYIMTCLITKDPDNTWYVYIDWSAWFSDQVDNIGGTFTITQSDWFPDAAISEEGDNYGDTEKQTAFYGSGGVAGVNYNLLNRISYTSSTLSGQTFTEDRTIQVRIKDK